MKALEKGAPIEALEYMIENNADVNILTNKKETCLFFVSSLENTKFLIEKKVDLNQKNSDSQNVLYSLFSNRSTSDTIHFLVNQKIDVNIPSFLKKNSPLHLSISTNRFDVAQ